MPRTKDEVIVYLGGTMTNECKFTQEWRQQIEVDLPDHFTFLDPYRRSIGKTIVNNGLGHKEGGMAFVHGDRIDVDRCDVMFIVLPLSTEELGRQSIGTFWECGWANELQKPIILVDLTPDREYIDHPFFQTYAAAMCTDVESGIEYLKGF